jgi:hypothetical protein
MAGRIVIPLVQTEVLGLLGRRLRPIHHHGLESGDQQLRVMDIRPRDGRPQRACRRLDHQAAFYPFFPRSVGLRPTRSPPMRALPMAVSAACHCQSTRCSSSQASTSTAQRRAKIPR